MQKFFRIIATAAIILLAISLDIYASSASEDKDFKSKKFINSIKSRELAEIVTNEMLSKGYIVDCVNDYKAVYSKKAEPLVLKFVLSVMDGGADERISFDFISSGSGVMAMARLDLVSGAEICAPSGGDYRKDAWAVDKVQKILSQVKYICATPSKREEERKKTESRKIALGMTEADVKTKLGRPMTVKGVMKNRTGQDIEVWEYNWGNFLVSLVTLPISDLESKQYWVYLYGGKVVQWGRAMPWDSAAYNIYKFTFPAS